MLLEGRTQREVKEAFGFSQQAVQRHAAAHLTPVVRRAAALLAPVSLPPSAASAGAVLAAALPQLNSLAAIAARLDEIAGSMKSEREGAQARGASGVAIAAATAETRAVGDLAKLLSMAQGRADSEETGPDYTAIAGAIMGEIRDEATRAAVAQRLRGLAGG